ncbi:MAG: hypothetical protein AB1584_00100 [Pseudomonadota bacterium]
MKTQLLEDIGQSAELPLTPPKTVGNAKAKAEAPHPAPPGTAQPGMPRSATGVWRQKPAAEPPIPAKPAEEAAPLELNKVFEELAALEAQFVAPEQQHEPVAPAVEPRHALPASPAESPHQPGIAPDQAMDVPDPVPNPVPDPVPNPVPKHAPDPAPGAAAPQEPLFDFTPPPPERAAANPFTPASSGLTRSSGRYLLWATGLLAVALLVLGGRWFYQERNDAASLALIAGEAKQAPRVDQALKPPALAAQEAAPAPEAEARHSFAMPAIPASQAAPGVPPLVMLEPDPPAAGKGEQPPRSAVDQEAPPKAPQPAPVVEKKPASPPPKPAARTARASSGKAAEPAKKTRKREPAPQPVRAAAVGKEKPSGQEASLAATLKACREHGYHATQCIKRDCRVTQYGFACRGQ